MSRSFKRRNAKESYRSHSISIRKIGIYNNNSEISTPRKIESPYNRRVENEIHSLSWCNLCGTPRTCAARIVFTFSEAEYQRAEMRLAVHRAARATGWSASCFVENAIDALAKENVHFCSHACGRPFDLDLSPIEGDADGFDVDLRQVKEAMRLWIRAYLLLPRLESDLPSLRGTGKARFMCLASILVAVLPDLEHELRVMSEAEYVRRCLGNRV